MGWKRFFNSPNICRSRGTRKYRLKVIICGGISSRGPSQFKIWFEKNHYLFKCSFCAYKIKNKVFKNNMDPEIYNQIIRHTFFPFFIFNREIVHLHQTPSILQIFAWILCVTWISIGQVFFCSVLSWNILKSLKIIKIKSPPLSPDLNPIEWVLGDLKKFVRKQMCKNEQEVRTAIEQFRRSLTPEICAQYISKLEKVNKA